MIVGLGIDLIATRRFARELARGEWHECDGLFAPGEIRHCNQGKKPALRYAACFAAKEATLKALGIETADLGMFLAVELAPAGEGNYRVELHGGLKAESERLGIRAIWLALATTRSLTGAMVILEM